MQTVSVKDEAAALRQQIAAARRERDELLRLARQVSSAELAGSQEELPRHQLAGAAGGSAGVGSAAGAVADGVEGIAEDAQQFAAVADTIQLYRQCAPNFPRSMRLERRELSVIFGEPELGHRGFFGALVGFDQCISSDDLVAHVSRHTSTGVAHLLVAAADDRQDGRLAANDAANVMRLVKHFFENYALCGPSADFVTAVLEKIAAEVRQLDETCWTEAAAVSLVRLQILRVEHLPATADGDFECGVTALQQEFYEAAGDSLDSDTESEADVECATRSGRWSDSFKVIGRTEQRTVFPDESGRAQFERGGPGFACLAPGKLLLKLCDHNWLHDNVEGSRAVMLDGSKSGQQRVALQRNGTAVVGADGFCTEIVYQLEPASQSIPRAEALRWREPMDAVVTDFPSDISQAMICCAETVKSFKRQNGPLPGLPDSMQLGKEESVAAGELHRRLPAMETSRSSPEHLVQARLVHALMAREAAGKFPEGSVVSEVILLLLSFASSADSVSLSEYGHFLSLLKHYLRNYATSDVDFCTDVLEPLVTESPQPVLQAEQHRACNVDFAIVAVEHPPALESASILLYQQGCYDLLADEVQNPGAASVVVWGQSNRKRGGVDFQHVAETSTICFSRRSSRFECVAPGHVQLKLLSNTAGLSTRLIGSTWLALGEGCQVQKGRTQLVRAGARLLGADGLPTVIEYSVGALVPSMDQMWERDSSSSPLVIDRQGRAHSPLHDTLRRLKQERERREEQHVIEQAVKACKQQRLREELHRRQQHQQEQQQQELETLTGELHDLETELAREMHLAERVEQQLAEARAVTVTKAEQLAASRAAVVAQAARGEADVADATHGHLLGLPPATVATHPEKLLADKPQSVDNQGQLESADGWQIVAPPTRAWARTHSPAVDPTGSSVYLKVVQYNILADHLASPVDRIERYVYDQCPPYAVSWSYRLELLLLELQGYDADVLCLQEVQKDHFDDAFRPRLRELGYDGIFGPRNTELAPEKIAQGRCPDGVAIFFRSARLELLDQKSVVYRDAAAALPRHRDDSGDEDERDTEGLPEKVSSLILPQQGDLRRSVMSNEGGALLALLQFVGTGAQVCCVSTHLWHEPTRPDVRCVQAALLSKEVRRMMDRAGSGTGVVMCGDFNSHPTPGAGGGVYELLSTGRLGAEHEDHPVAKGSTDSMDDLTCTPMSSAYAQNGWEPICTMKDHRGERCLDYIWLSGAARLVRTLTLPYGEAHAGGEAGAAAGFSRIPNCQWPSDHLAIGAEVLLPMRHGDE